MNSIPVGYSNCLVFSCFRFHLLALLVVAIWGVTFVCTKVLIGAGSIVTRDIPADCVAVGNPCKVVKKVK